MGGFVSLGLYKWKFDQPELVLSNGVPAYNATYTGMADASIDFTLAAERTVNSVVHVKTQSKMQPVSILGPIFLVTNRNHNYKWPREVGSLFQLMVIS